MPNFWGWICANSGLGTAEVEAIVQHADRITRLIQQLLTFARAKEQPMTTLAVQEPCRQRPPFA